MGTLASLTSTRGLPRGRGSLPREQVGRAQRDRLLRAMTAAVAELGYANVRIADVVDRARVSRQSFYEQFPDKEACFLAAHQRGIAMILERLAQSAADIQNLDPRAQLRAGISAYLGLAAAEPEFAQCMLIELPAIGPAGLQARLAAHRQIALLLRDWHQSAQAAQPRLRTVPAARYAAAVGAVHDLVYELVATGRASEVPTLEDDSYGAIAALLELPRS
jgi:AcrR family transcriptional regulator